MVKKALRMPGAEARGRQGWDRGLAVMVAEFPCALRRAAQAATANRSEEGSR